MCSCAPVFFFFQAEDGIRDATVTGVQTCALPIFRSDPQSLLRRLRRQDRAKMRLRSRLRELRSEERRVGKECRSRWSPGREKKNRNKLSQEAAPHTSLVQLR